jgi:hypothetical protein
MRFGFVSVQLSTALRLNSSPVVAHLDQLVLAREKERALDRAMAIPAQKVF